MARTREGEVAPPVEEEFYIIHPTHDGTQPASTPTGAGTEDKPYYIPAIPPDVEGPPVEPAPPLGARDARTTYTPKRRET